MLSGSCTPPLDLDPKFSAAGRGFRSLWAMCDLADSLIGKANQIEASCHISFFSEFKNKKPALPSDKNRQSGWPKLSPLHFLPSKNALRSSGLGLNITWKPSRRWGRLCLRAHQYPRAKTCQFLLL